MTAVQFQEFDVRGYVVALDRSRCVRVRRGLSDRLCASKCGHKTNLDCTPYKLWTHKMKMWIERSRGRLFTVYLRNQVGHARHRQQASPLSELNRGSCVASCLADSILFFSAAFSCHSR